MGFRNNKLLRVLRQNGEIPGAVENQTEVVSSITGGTDGHGFFLQTFPAAFIRVYPVLSVVKPCLTFSASTAGKV